MPFALIGGAVGAHLRGQEEDHHRRHRHLVQVNAESYDSNKEWIVTAQDEDGADYVGSPVLFSTTNTDAEEEQEQYEIITTLLNWQNDEESS